ncbi:hypothetical protein QJ857_gp0514 [Tupanvirus soda lake]|uniref:Uncharacterized protein n=2 Tax=Tupanvirus TaxID=2094720 RepID=A0A6N1NSV8_9VIRU|nr:hypothetical protein QJ857_gp0514 [Tupanvirus soda lake]QKU35527.1 hypothetical protein [Tupanvirus soda lake]
MELSRMSLGITKIIDKQYSEFIDDECLDIIQIKNICNLYKVKTTSHNSVNLSEINFSSPEFKKISSKTQKKNQADVLKSDEFLKKYAFFIRTIYACLKINVDIFDVNGGIVTLKNNYQLLKSLETKKKQLIAEHLNILKMQYKNASQKIGNDYENYFNSYITKIKIIDKITAAINKLINGGVFDKTDNLLTLILPYFYTYTEFIEEYN